jgi:toxin FitB
MKILDTNVFQIIDVLAVNENIVEKAISLRQQRKMSLGDAIIAATALEYNATLVTRNSSDFDWINNLMLENPF